MTSPLLFLFYYKSIETCQWEVLGQLENTETQERKREWKQPERCGEREPVSWPYCHQESQISHELAPHWVHSSIRRLIPGRHCRFVIVGPRVVVYRLSSSQVDGYTTVLSCGVRLSHDKQVRVGRLTTGIRQYSHLSCLLA